MGSDFNMVLNELDRYPQLIRKKCGSSEKFKKLLNRLNVEDLWRIFNPNTQVFTYKATNNISGAKKKLTTLNRPHLLYKLLTEGVITKIY